MAEIPEEMHKKKMIFFIYSNLEDKCRDLPDAKGRYWMLDTRYRIKLNY